MTQIEMTIFTSITGRRYFYKGKRRKYLHEHTCYCCEQVFLSTMERTIHFCPTCLKDKRRIKAASQVKHNVHRAEKAGLPATLTPLQWIAILDRFNWLCAYCQSSPYILLEHFIPINLGGGTIPGNILPSCQRCNRLKNGIHPSLVPAEKGMTQALQRVQAYLSSCGSEVEA